MPLDPDDHRLSMKIAPRSRGEEPEGLRTLIIHRFSDTMKLVVRRGIRTGKLGSYCEDCDSWDREPLAEEVPVEFRCNGCSRVFRLEFAVYEDVTP
jgi:hypothetical protein